MKSEQWIRVGWVSWILSVAFFGTLGVGCAKAEELVVPADGSVSASEYAQLGVPDPDTEWSIEEYHEALQVLAQVPPTKLPRLGSERSGLVFERLLTVHSRTPTAETLMAGSWAPGLEIEGVSLPGLYSTRDGYLFDRELAAIRSQTLKQTLASVEPPQELEIRAESFTKFASQANTAEERERLRDGARRARDAATQASDLVQRQVVRLMSLLAVPQVSDRARTDIVTSLDGLHDRLAVYLSEDQLSEISALIREAALSPHNHSIKSELEDLRERLH